MKSLGMALGTLLCAAVVTAAAENPLTLWYSSDAGDSFTDALPIGNGYMGSLIYGGVTKDAREALFRGDYRTAESRAAARKCYAYAPASSGKNYRMFIGRASW